MWTGTRQALTHGPMAPQVAGLLSPAAPADFGRVMGEEDCLFLSVFGPAFMPGAVPRGRDRRPVMVWIHGGGNAVGTAATYDVVRNLAAHDGVVVVTVNYRLGVLGWFNHPALLEDPGLTPAEASGNFALLDLVMAMQWVRDNIDAFGGDPGNVTVFGESAGAQNVLLLLACPLAAGLFHRAIAQSPVAETFSMSECLYGRQGASIASRLYGGIPVVERLVQRHAGPREDAAAQDMSRFLRGLNPAQLIASYTPGSAGIYLAPRPARDGVVLPRMPLREAFAQGAFHRVPVIMGSNRDEVRTFLADKPEHSRLLFGKLPLLRDREAYVTESSIQSRAWRALHVDTVGDALLEAGHADVWSYRFDWDEAPRIPGIRPDILLGAAHAMEMPFVFRDLAGESDGFKVFTPFNRRGREAVTQVMAQAWTTFARHGEPTLPDGTAWGRRQREGPVDSLLIDSPRDGGCRMGAARETVAAIKQSLRALPPVLACRAYARTLLWHPLFEGHGSEEEYDHWCRDLGVNQPASAHRPAVEV